MSTEFFNDQWRIPSNENQNKVSNYSMEFDSTNYIDFGNVNDFDTTDAFSGSCWLYTYQSADTDIILSKEAASGTFKGYALYLTSSNTLRFILCPYWNSDYFDVFTTTALTTNTWNHIAFTYDGSTTLQGKCNSDVPSPSNSYGCLFLELRSLIGKSLST